jgi:gamma-glutamyltranspeptidase
MRANDGAISHADLETRHIEETIPLWGTHRDVRIAANNPPSGGKKIPGS